MNRYLYTITYLDPRDNKVHTDFDTSPLVNEKDEFAFMEKLFDKYGGEDFVMSISATKAKENE